MALPPSPAQAPNTPDRPQRVGFLFNHEEQHQVAHTAPVISALQKKAPWMSVEILASSAAQMNRVTQLLDQGSMPPPCYRLKWGAGSAFLEWLTGGLAPLRRIDTLRRNVDLFGKYDALIVPESTSLLLKTRFGLDDLTLINLPHGAGDRSIGYGKERLDFDFVLLAGQKLRDRMLADGTIRPDDHAIVGYPKFDTVAGSPRPRFFDNGRPTVLYNPHFDPQMSSWYDFGEKILNFFARQDRYNLIFAPHVMLFRRRIHASTEHRRLRFRRHLPERFGFQPHMLIDTGSERSVDMSYTRAADIYLGDVSSQIYEFLMEPRPAIFLNAHGADWRCNPNYGHWQLGQVIDSPAQLAEALDQAEHRQAEFRQAQIDAYAETFSLDPETSSADRAADAIVEFLSRDRSKTSPSSP